MLGSFVLCYKYLFACTGKKLNVSVLPNDANFYGTLNEVGLCLSRSKDQSNQLSIDQAVFKFRLTQKLYHDFTHEITDEICDGFSKHVEKSIHFNQCLSATWLYPSNAGSVPIVQESVVRLLLGIEKLQPRIISILLEKMPEFMEDYLRDNTLTKEEFQQIPGLVLNQLKWLDCIVDGKELCGKLLEILTIAPVELQRDIITSLPEILDDDVHRTVALHLKELLQSNSQLTSAIIDCFANLHLSDDLIVDILEAALQRVDSADFSNLPCLLSFIMQSGATSDIENIILQLREKLSLPSTFVAPLISSTPVTRCTSGIQGGNEFMVFDTLRSMICFQTKVADGWMKVCMYVYVCMYICMYVCMYACMYVRMYVCMCVCMYVCMHACMCVCMYLCMYVCTVCVYVCMCMYVRMYVCMSVCVYICVYVLCVYICMYVCIYVYMYCVCMYVCMCMYVYTYICVYLLLGRAPVLLVEHGTCVVCAKIS